MSAERRPGTGPRPLRTVIAVGVAMGLLGDLLLRGSEGPGLNFFLLFLGLAAAVGVVTRRAGVRLSAVSARSV